MQITHDERNRVFLLKDKSGQEIGQLSYRTGRGRINAMRTYVAPAHREHGHGTQLVDALASYARDTGAKIVPVCSFTKLLFARHPDKYRDVAYTPSSTAAPASGIDKPAAQ